MRFLALPCLFVFFAAASAVPLLHLGKERIGPRTNPFQCEDARTNDNAPCPRDLDILGQGFNLRDGGFGALPPVGTSGVELRPLQQLLNISYDQLTRGNRFTLPFGGVSAPFSVPRQLSFVSKTFNNYKSKNISSSFNLQVFFSEQVGLPKNDITSGLLEGSASFDSSLSVFRHYQIFLSYWTYTMFDVTVPINTPLYDVVREEIEQLPANISDAAALEEWFRFFDIHGTHFLVGCRWGLEVWLAQQMQLCKSEGRLQVAASLATSLEQFLSRWLGTGKKPVLNAKGNLTFGIEQVRTLEEMELHTEGVAAAGCRQNDCSELEILSSLNMDPEAIECVSPQFAALSSHPDIDFERSSLMKYAMEAYFEETNVGTVSSKVFLKNASKCASGSANDDREDDYFIWAMVVTILLAVLVAACIVGIVLLAIWKIRH